MELIFGPMAQRSQRLHSAAAALFMVAAVIAAAYLTPTRSWFDEIGRPQLETLVPHNFGDWHDTGESALSIVNPEQGEQLRVIYNQTLTRVYRHGPTGRLLMLAIAHGTDQAYATQLHRPEMCYRAQGFFVSRQEDEDLQTTRGILPVTHLWTSAGTRNEPVTYWIRTGDRLTRGSLQMNLARLSLALRGNIADGLLVRVSEVSNDDGTSFALQQQFLRDLTASVQEDQLNMLLGSATS